MPTDFVFQLGDCLDMLPHLKRESVDLVLTDPPYKFPRHFVSKMCWKQKWSDRAIFQRWWRTVCEVFYPIMKSSGHVLVFCNSDSYPVFYPEMFERWDWVRTLVWNKINPGPGFIWRHQHELILAAHNKNSYRPRKTLPDVLNARVTPPRRREHPVDKPVELLLSLIKALCPPGGTVLDPFMGGGNTAIAAREAGARFIGMELNVEYFRVARERHSKRLPPECS